MMTYHAAVERKQRYENILRNIGRGIVLDVVPNKREGYVYSHIIDSLGIDRIFAGDKEITVRVLRPHQLEELYKEREKPFWYSIIMALCIEHKRKGLNT